MMASSIALAGVIGLVLALPLGLSAETIVVGSKKFTESVVLGELIAHVLRADGLEVETRPELGGTRVVFSALERGDIDVYAEYTGTLRQELLPGGATLDRADMARALAERGIVLGRPLGFDNTYALGVARARAEALGLRRVSDLRRLPDLRFGFTNEFMDRGDGWPALRDHYRLPQTRVRGLDHDLAYRGLRSGDLDLVDLYSTDADIVYYGLVTLEDDEDFFPEYQAVVLHRQDLGDRAPSAPRALARLAGSIDAASMIAMNARAKLERVPASEVAAHFARETLGLEARAVVHGPFARLVENTLAHLTLVGISLAGAVALAIPLGIVAARRPAIGQLVLGATGILQTIPSLALLVFMIPLLGIGTAPAIAALFLYSLLPIVRNTYTGLHEIPDTLHESAEALGLSRGALLRRVELPLATPSILAGIKTSAVINVGTATLGALIGAGGYGQPILTGIRLDDTGLILQGAIPAAALALIVQGLFDWSERIFVPRGLRISREA